MYIGKRTVPYSMSATAGRGLRGLGQDDTITSIVDSAANAAASIARALNPTPVITPVGAVSQTAASNMGGILLLLGAALLLFKPFRKK